MKRTKKRKQHKEESMIGRIIDLPMEEFEKELVKQKVNIGTMNNLILNLEAVYNELRVRKDQILDAVFKGMLDRNESDVNKSINGLYAEMTKVEQKITYLKSKVKELVDVG